MFLTIIGYILVVYFVGVAIFTTIINFALKHGSKNNDFDYLEKHPLRAAFLWPAIFFGIMVAMFEPRK